MKQSLCTRLVCLALLTTPFVSHAWGRRGHQIVGETGAALAAKEPGAAGLKGHTFDFGYYANVPDIIWKRPATYGFEKPQHYMDLEIFEREFKKQPEVKAPLELDRESFEKQFPEVKADAGRAFWRVRELIARLEPLSEKLRATPDLKADGRQDLQGQWVVIAGVMAHYLGDLSMPMHVTENFDGQLTNQQGLHSFFEDVCVDELYPRLLVNVDKLATREWVGFKARNHEKPVLQLLTELAKRSEARLKSMLAIDKKYGRKPSVVCGKYEAMITRGMADSSLALAELYRRQMGWTFDDNRFYYFRGEPEYIKPGVAALAPATAPAAGANSAPPAANGK